MTYRSYLLPKLQDYNGQHGMAEILSGLYIGNFRDSKDMKQLDIHKITHILSIHDDARKLFKDKKYLIISAADSPKQDLMQFVPHCNDFIHAARLRGGHVLVHCLAGISRSVTIAAAYIISVTGLSVAEALQAVRSSRTIANPNFGFQKQLNDFEVNGGAQKERKRLSNHFNKSVNSSPVAIPGRLIHSRQNTLTWGGDFEALADEDRQKVQELLLKYRQLVESGDLCAGDCPNDGITCSSGVCRAHLRTANSSFLRRGATANSSLRSKSHINLWCPKDKIPTAASASNPSTPVRRLTRGRSDYSLEPPNQQLLPRCLSDQPLLMIDETTSAASVSVERLAVPEEQPCASSVRKRSAASPIKSPHHVSWGAAASTIRATHRLSNGRPGSAPNLARNNTSTGSISSPPSPRFRQRNFPLV